MDIQLYNLCCIHPWNTFQNYEAYMKIMLKKVNCIFGTITQIINSQLPGPIKETHIPPAAGLLPDSFPSESLPLSLSIDGTSLSSE